MSALNLLDAATFDSLSKEVYRRTGIHLDDKKRELLLGRMRRRAKEAGHADYESFLSSVRTADAKSAEVNGFIDAVTTNKTRFFRNTAVWEHLWKEYLPTLHARTVPLRLWSAACSTGQEVASIGMLCEAYRRLHLADLRYQVVGSDVSAKMVEVASRQTFDQKLVSAILAPSEIKPAEFFRERGEQQVLDPGITKNFKFIQHNLFDKPKQASFDLIFVRNVIIYFTPEDQGRVLNLMIDSLAPGGMLVTGDAESPMQHTDRLEFIGPCLYIPKR